jgi:hypothetical protein
MTLMEKRLFGAYPKAIKAAGNLTQWATCFQATFWNPK